MQAKLDLNTLVALCAAFYLMFVLGKCQMVTSVEKGVNTLPFLRGSLDEDTELMLAARHVVARHLQGCHLIIAAPRSSVLALTIRETRVNTLVTTVLELNSDASLTQHVDIWSSGHFTCRALLLHYTAENINLAIRFLSTSQIWQRPEVRVVMMSGGEDTQDTDHQVLLSHPVLRNTRHVLHMEHQATRHRTTAPGIPHADVHYRCLFCDERTSAVQLTRRWYLKAGVPLGFTSLRDYSKNFHGHRFRIVAMNYFPYISYKRSRDMPGNVAYLTDSLNTRMITVLANSLNFTYDVREPEDEQWGLEISGGNWTGIVGTLQHEKADFSMDLTLTPQRAAVVEFCRVYIDEDTVILSTKPRPLPEYLSLINPFGGLVWMMVVVEIFVWAATLWLLLNISVHVHGGRRLSFNTALFYGWGLLLEEQPLRPPKEIAGKVLVGTLLVVCLILRTAYTGSLTSHLVVQGKSPTINSLEEMVDRRYKEGWKWGTKSFNGAFNSLLSTSGIPAFHVVKEHMQLMEPRVGIQKVLEGKFSYIRNFYITRIMMETEYMGDKGYSPFHISSTKYPLFAGNTWAFRTGTPFISTFDKAIALLLSSGLVKHWMDDVIQTFLMEDRRQKKTLVIGDPSFATSTRDDGDEVVLGLLHLQATFYVLMLGATVAAFTFLAEHLFHPYLTFTNPRLVITT